MHPFRIRARHAERLLTSLFALLFVPSTPISQQTKGTQSFGKRLNKTHTLCRRCGERAFHIQKKTCSSCSYPAATMRKCTLLIARAMFCSIPFTNLSKSCDPCHSRARCYELVAKELLAAPIVLK